MVWLDYDYDVTGMIITENTIVKYTQSEKLNLVY